MDNNEKLQILRHSAAHLLAHAVIELFPKTKLTIGPATKTGFFYDFLPEKNFKSDDLPRIEKRMRELAEKNFSILGEQIPKAKAREIYKDNPFKLEIIDAITDATVGMYTQGEFFDLCRGGHVDALGEIEYFKLTGISGAYWRGDRSGTKLQRITGVAFSTKEEWEGYLKREEEAKKYDHRRLGIDLDLFSFHDEAPGLPFFHPKGTVVYNKLLEYSRCLQEKHGYKEIKTPLIMRQSVWETSGHYDNYKENMYFTAVDEDPYCVRPMNCPSSMLSFKERVRSYRELPLRLSEYGLVHRYELSGVLHGLFRVRGFTQDDTHIYCRPEDIKQEIIGVIDLAKELYARFDFDNVTMALSTRPEKSMGSEDLWNTATHALDQALKESGVPYELEEGEGAFYGPKIDMFIEDAMGRQWQCGTVQVDFFLPRNFKLEYVDSDQSRKTPIVIHRALYGSIERFYGIVLEHYRGRFPFWIAPVQMRALVITDAQREYARSVVDDLVSRGFRVELDETKDQISAQIRRAQSQYIPCMLVIGKKEQENNTVTLRYLDGKQEFGISIDALREKVSVLNAIV